MDLQTTANLRLILATRQLTRNPVADADHQTTMADLRAAVCLAGGIDPDDIGSLGHDHSAAGYALVRASWVDHIEQFGLTLFDSACASVLAEWREIQPELARGDDWQAEGSLAHKRRYAGDCGRETCVICFPVPEEWL